MARPSKLTERQWEQIGKRLLSGEGTSELAREYGVSKGAISQRFSKRSESIKTAASLINKTDDALSKLNINEQLEARNLANKLKNISGHLASAAEFGTMTAHRLSMLAHNEVQKIDDVNPLESLESMKGVAALTRLANDSAEIGLNLLKANKETVDSLNKADENPEPKQIIFTVQDARA